MQGRRPSLDADMLPAFQEETPFDLEELAAGDDFFLDWPDERDLTEEEEATAREDAEKVCSMAQLVALDWDKTLLSIHTGGGYWQDSAAELAKHMRPVFKIFLPELLARGTLVAIVTFSPQPQLIKEALQLAFVECCDTSEVLVVGGQGVLVSGEDGCIAEAPTPTTGGRRHGKNHKQKHIASVVSHYSQNGVVLKSPDVFLIDDDPNNIEAAREHGMKAARFDPEQPHAVLSDALGHL